MQEVDRFALARYAAAAATVVDAYERYDYPTIFQTINQFTTVDLSAFYADVSKDRLYTFAAASPERRSAQTAMYIIADGLVRLLAPILPVTTDELWRHLPGNARGLRAPGGVPAAADLDARCATLRSRRGGNVLLEARSAVNAELEVLREQKAIGSSLQATVVIDVDDPAAAALLKRYAAELPMLFIVSQVDARAKRGGSEPLAERRVADAAAESALERGRSTRRPRTGRSARAAGASSRTFRRPPTATGCAIAAWTP